MGSRDKEERKFSEDLERMLSGQEVMSGEEAGDDYGKMLGFARKLMHLSAKPSPEFTEQLRRRLLLKMVEQEAGAARAKEKRDRFWESLGNLVPRSPVWRTAVTTFAVLALAFLIAWAIGVFHPTTGPIVGGPPEETPILGFPPPAVLTLEAVPSETTTYRPGEEIRVDLVFSNVSSESLTLAPFPPRIQIQLADSGEVIRSLAEGNETREIAPSGNLTYTVVWNQLDDQEQPVGPGLYALVVSDVTVHKISEPQEMHLDFGRIADVLLELP